MTTTKPETQQAEEQIPQTQPDGEQQEDSLDAVELAQKMISHRELIEGHINQYVKNQPEVTRAVTLAILAGLKIYIPGGPGLGKTLTSDVASDYLQLKQAYICLNPDVTPADILGKKRLNLWNHEEEFVPGVVLKGDIVVFDELNRASDKAQTAMIEPLSKKGLVTLPTGECHPVSNILTVIAMGNLEEDGGTRPIISAIWDRFDCVVPARGITKESVLSVVDNYVREPNADPSDPLISKSPEQMREMIAKYRKVLDHFKHGLADEPRHLIAHIVAHFHDPKKWRIRTSNRTAEALVRTATALSVTEIGKRPARQHVWEAAKWCLGGLEPRDESFFTSERLEYIYEEIEKLKNSWIWPPPEAKKS